MQGVLVLSRNTVRCMLHIEPGHVGLACHQLLTVGSDNGGNVRLTNRGLVCILLRDLIGDVDHGWEGGKGGVRVIPAHHSAQRKSLMTDGQVKHRLSVVGGYMAKVG